MTQLQHVYLTAHGQFTSGSWVGEEAQFGLRLAFIETGGGPSKGEIFTVPLNGDVVVDQGVAAGTHGQLARTWSARLGPTGSAVNCDSAYQIDLAEDLWTFLNACKGYMATPFSWTHIKLAPISAEGKTVGTASVYTLTLPLAGTGTGLQPPQLAMAVSMRANILGRRGRGRIYLPAVNAGSVTTDGTIATVTSSALRAAMVTLIGNLQNAPGAPAYSPLVAIMSAGSASAVRPSEVRTGQRFDTIRSRREQVPETYTATAL